MRRAGTAEGRPRRPGRALAVAVLAVVHAAAALAQSAAGGAEPAPPPSRWAGQVAQLDDALRAQWLVATTPRADWLAGTLDAGDAYARTARLAAARVAAPSERLFVASLATACLAPVRPWPPACDATDRLADWATRDVDNGVPSLLLADRARARNNAAAMLAYLGEASERPRFDDYRLRGVAVTWDEVRAAAGPYDPAARVLLVLAYGALAGGSAVDVVDGLCPDGRAPTDAIRAACNAAGTALAQRAATWPLRVAGARLAERTAAAGPARDDARQRLADVERRGHECVETRDALAAALDGPDAAARGRAVAQWEVLLAREPACL